MKNMKKKHIISQWIFWATIPLLWIGIFILFIVPNEVQVSAPDEYPRVILQNVQPVDPRDLLRGDFVTLQYEFTRPRNFWNREESENEVLEELKTIVEEEDAGTEVFLSYSVDEETRIGTLEGVSFEKPNSELFIAAEVRGREWRKEIRAGIERFFVPTGKGWEIERIQREGNLSAEIAINPKTGKALIVDLWQGEKKIDTENIDAEIRGW